ncbi:MAG TPA: GNAT family N-acetyltransferase [Gemmatimonadaceae bacterium]|nr:GNAT family N-acetyltransferase [Gemmatimonadaceae bacterium]
MNVVARGLGTGRLTIASYDPAMDDEWDELVSAAPMGTFLHTRRFLGYHGDRFVDRSLVLRDDSKLVGVLPAAVDPHDDQRIVSHPGITFGGLVHGGQLVGAATVGAVGAVCEAYAELGFTSLGYKAVPHIYQLMPSQDDIYALVQLGAQIVRCELSCAIDLSNRGQRSDRRRRGERKAKRRGITVIQGVERLADLWPVIEENLAAKHRARPAHTLDEMRLLVSLFPESIEIVTASLEGSVVAGVVLFKSSRVVHAQYIASSDPGRDVAALDAVFERCIEGARSSGARFFDFGTSTEPEGQRLNATLYKFKSEFGGTGVVQESYELKL